MTSRTIGPGKTRAPGQASGVNGGTKWQICPCLFLWLGLPVALSRTLFQRPRRGFDREAAPPSGKSRWRIHRRRRRKYAAGLGSGLVRKPRRRCFRWKEIFHSSVNVHAVGKVCPPTKGQSLPFGRGTQTAAKVLWPPHRQGSEGTHRLPCRLAKSSIASRSVERAKLWLFARPRAKVWLLLFPLPHRLFSGRVSLGARNSLPQVVRATMSGATMRANDFRTHNLPNETAQHIRLLPEAVAHGVAGRAWRMSKAQA